MYDFTVHTVDELVGMHANRRFLLKAASTAPVIDTAVIDTLRAELLAIQDALEAKSALDAITVGDRS